MSKVYVITEKLHAQSGLRCCGFGDCICPTKITAAQLVDVLNSAALPGPDRHYMLKDE